MSPRLLHLGLIFSVVSLPASRAEDAAPEPQPPAYVLKNKSRFTPLAETQRAPFWPIGWVKRKAAEVAVAQAPVAVAPKITLDPKDFKVTSILVGNPSFAIINGRTYSEGEFLRAPRTAAPAVAAAGLATPAPRTRVYRIGDGAVVLQNQEQFLTVSLQRPELAQRLGEETLLLEDRP